MIGFSANMLALNDDKGIAVKDRLSDDLVVAFTKQAMAPFDCVAEFGDFGNRFGFAVYFEHRDRVVVSDLLARDMRDPEVLESRLMMVRNQLIDDGEKLNSWQGIPDLTDC